MADSANLIWSDGNNAVWSDANNAVTSGEPSVPSPYVNRGGIVWLNLEEPDDGCASIPWQDAFQLARSWVSHQASPFVWEGGPGATLDANGWPTALSANEWIDAIIFSGQERNMPSGRYIITWDGTATIEPYISGDGGSLTTVLDTAGRIEIDLTPSDNLFALRIKSITSAVSNIRVILPGMEATYATEVFHPTFTQRIADLGVTCLRMMDWGQTNDSTLVNWADRNTLTSHSQAAGKLGVAIEYMVDLCNATGCDLWYCVPHEASDAFCTSAAQLIQSRLNSNLRVLLEYSNEVWNGQFDQADYCETEGVALALGPDDNRSKLRYYAQRAMEIKALFAAEFSAEPGRLLMIAGGQARNSFTGTEVMDWNPDTASLDSGTAGTRWDALAIAPYFGNKFGTDAEVATTLTWSVRRLLAECLADMEDLYDPSTGEVYQNIDEARTRGIGCVAYEGTQHLVGVEGNENNDTLTELFHAANRHPFMAACVLADLQRWEAETADVPLDANARCGGFGLFTLSWAPSKFGAWGLVEYEGQPSSQAHKWRAVQAWRKGLDAPVAWGDS